MLLFLLVKEFKKKKRKRNKTKQKNPKSESLDSITPQPPLHFLLCHCNKLPIYKLPIFTASNSWVGKIHRRRDRLPTPGFLGFPCGSASQESACNAGDLGSIPGLGRSTGEGKGYPFQYSCKRN